MNDPYIACPCGSGKRLKWCCLDIMPKIEQAENQFQSGQVDAALAAMERLTQQHPDNCEVWGRYATMLDSADRPAAALAAVATALEKNPNYAFGHVVSGSLLEETDLNAAIAHYRKGLELASPTQFLKLGSLAAHVGELELQRNQPLAAQAILAYGLVIDPTCKQIVDVQRLMHQEKCLPDLAFEDLSFRAIDATASEEQKQLWETTLARYRSGRLSDALTAFQQFAAQYPKSAAAWYNLGLVHAWSGENAAAVEALHRYVELEADERKAGKAWAIAELLKFGAGMEQNCDYLELQAWHTLNNAEDAVARLRRHPFVCAKKYRPPYMMALLLDRPPPAPDQTLSASDLPRILAHILLAGPSLVLLHNDELPLETGRARIEQMLEVAGSEWRYHTAVPDFPQLREYLALVYLPEEMPPTQAKPLLESIYRQRLEEHWLQQPRKSLGLSTPLDAAGHPLLRKKLIGVIDFFEQLMQPLAEFYDFDRLRHKLGLPTVRPRIESALEIADMSAAELAGLNHEDLSDGDLLQAFYAAKRLDAAELAGRFAEVLTARPPAGDDRYPLYQHLIQQAVADKLWGKALALVESGMRHDCIHQSGCRRNDFELRRAQIHLQSGDLDAARDLFTQLVDRVPSNLDVLGQAAEAMLSMQQPTPAREFAQRGLFLAEKAGDRDRVGYFAELCHAAMRQAAPV